MKRSVCFYTLLLLAIFIWSFGPTAREAKALTKINLISPGDSTKIITAFPTFKWEVDKDKPVEETPKRFTIKLASDPLFTPPLIWEDTIDGSATSVDYDGPALNEWEAYYWTMKVEVDSQTTREVDSVIIDTTITYWQEEYETHFTFFYTTATVFHIHADGSGDLRTIQEGIVWASSGDVVLVEPGIYYENLRFYKSNLTVTSNYQSDQDTATINKTIIDGSWLTRGDDNGSVVYFSSAVDSNSTLSGFTIRGGTGTKVSIGTEEKTNGGGIFCDVGSSPTIIYNVITDNQVDHDGGGIFIYSAAPNIFHNIITNNSTVKGSGGAIQCYYSIEVEASPGFSPDEQQGENKEKASWQKSQSNIEIKESPSSSKSRLKLSEDKIKNALNPKDATDVASAGALGSVAKSAQNNPPVAVVSWYARKDTIIQRDKYFIGDTLVFDGTESYDVDGDSIREYKWEYFRDKDCWKDPSTSVYELCPNATVCTLAITSNFTGLLRVRLRLTDMQGPPRGYSDVIVFSVQYPPYADAGEAAGLAPGDTVWLDGTASCDVNPGDVLSYNWTQLSGPVWVNITDPDSAKTYFVAEDSTYLGAYEFQLMVTDSLDTSYANVPVTISRPPKAMCEDDPVYGDTLVGGFTVNDWMTLDASFSSDPDPGDYVKYYIWEPVSRLIPTTDSIIEANLSLLMQPDSNRAVQTFRLSYGSFGGLLKFRLKVRDSYGVISQNYDSVFFSVQCRPAANAGKDTLLYSKTDAYLTGRGIEVNPDQRNSLKYNWRVISSPVVGFTIQPSDTVQSIYFRASGSGIYVLELTVDDRFGLSDPDEVVVVANKLPIAETVDILHAFEGDTVELDASASYDPDSADFQHEDSSDAGGLEFSWSVKSSPVGAEVPVIVDADQPIAKFVPYGTGTYVFEVLVNDTLSKNQPAVEGINIAELTVTVDSTYAHPIIFGNLIAHNFSASRGGGIDCNLSSPDIISNIFFKNQSKLSGGAVCARNFSKPQIKNNVFFGNISSDSTGGGIADLKAQLSPSASRGFKQNLAIQKNDFWDNRGGALYQASGIISDNIYDFPRLIDPDFGDFRFECSSPCYPDIGSVVYFDSCVTAERLEMVSLSLFQNPVATAVAHFIVNTDVPLKASPVAYVKIGENAPSPVYFVPISSKTYWGSFVFTASGTADISVFASSLVERDTIAADTFSVQFIGSGNDGKLTSFDKKVQVLFPEGSVKDDLYATCISVSQARYQFEEDPEMVACGEAYQVGPSISFDKDLIISFPLSQLNLKDKDKTLFSVYKYEDGKWNRLQSFLEENSVRVKAKSLGIYRLIYDPRGKHITGIPKTYQLFQNYPNPFNPVTQIRYDLPVSRQVKLTIYNVLGQKVKVLVDEIQDAGHKSVIWNGKDEGDGEVASGIYFYKIKAENYKKTKKMVLLK